MQASPDTLFPSLRARLKDSIVVLYKCFSACEKNHRASVAVTAKQGQVSHTCRKYLPEDKEESLRGQQR
jgi:hypothetical protein